MRPRSGGRLRVAGAVGALLALSAAVQAARPAQAHPVAAVAGTTPFDVQAARGQEMYQHICLECHGDHGQGDPGKAEPAVGAIFSARNPLAQVIFDVVRSGREPSLRAMTDQQIWDAIAAELKANGLELGDTVLNDATGPSVRTGPQASPDKGTIFPPGR